MIPQRILLTLFSLILAACTSVNKETVVTAKSLKNTSEVNLESKGLTPISGKEITRLILNKTVTGEYVSTPAIPLRNYRSHWMEFYNKNGNTIYRYCDTASLGNKWGCSKKITGQWQIFDNKLCLKYRGSKHFTHCFRVYFDNENYMIVATMGKTAGYVRGIATKASEGFIEEAPFNN